MTMPRWQVTVSEELAQKIRDREIVGQGGFQELGKALKNRLSGCSLAVDDEFRDRIEHYAFAYGNGGWQNFLREIIVEIERAPGHP